MTGKMRVVAVLLVALASSWAWADGTETLGVPTGLTLAQGSGIAAGGTGLESGTGTITIDIPTTATIQQVLLYWAGEFYTGSQETITIEGNPVTGQLIGGPAFFFNWQGDVYASAYRADITDLNLVTPGANSLTVLAPGYDDVNDGASLLVIYDDGNAANLQLLDGLDLAFFKFEEPRQTCIAQTFSFPAATAERTANLTIIAGSVEGRPNTITITIDETTTVLTDPLFNADGPNWDTLVLPVTIPAGATSVTIQPASTVSEDPLGASFMWAAAALSVPEPTAAYEGCSPGFWKQVKHFKYWVGYCPLSSFNRVFGVRACPDKTLWIALWCGGGGRAALDRQAVAALLNASNPRINYLYSVDEVKSIVKNAYATRRYEEAKNLLEAQNNAGCPLCH